MNYLKFVCLVLSTALIIAGCATAHSTLGTDFDSAKVGQIVKGKTTEDEITAVFGAPYSKSPETNGEERWLYSYITITAHARAGILGNMDTTATGFKKILNILFDKNKVVDNFTLNVGPTPSRHMTTS